MKKSLLMLSALAVAVFSLQGNPMAAQDCACECQPATCHDKIHEKIQSRKPWGLGVTGADGMTQPVDTVCATNPVATMKFAAHNHHFSPHPIYTYSKHGVEAGWTNLWNQQQMNRNPWHGGHSYWRFGTPTALVVPPTAAFQTTYRWGVGQTTSDPINHQFGMGGAGMIGGGGAQFSRTPYWPSSTNQFGVYPVRGPWN